jgi:hypothetical protein
LVNLKLEFLKYDITNYEDLKHLTKKFNDEFDKIQVSISKLELFLNNQQILLSTYDLNKKTHDLQKLNEQYIGSIFYILAIFSIRPVEKKIRTERFKK